jgi:hypothetical protein
MDYIGVLKRAVLLALCKPFLHRSFISPDYLSPEPAASPRSAHGRDNNAFLNENGRPAELLADRCLSSGF